MARNIADQFVIGVDFGTDSVRGVIMDARNGEELASGSFAYPRWRDGLYCNPERNQFRQHPLDCIEGFAAVIKSCLKQAGPAAAAAIHAISIDTTGSTPVAVDQEGTPLGLLPGFEQNPNAMFVLWKDLLGISGKGGFTFTQKYTGCISPGVFALFILGMFWKRTTGTAAVTGLITGFGLSVVFNNYAPAWFGHSTWLYSAYPNGNGGYEIPFLICMGLAFGFTMLAMILVSVAGPKVQPKAFDLSGVRFRLSPATAALVVATLILFTLLYVKFW